MCGLVGIVARNGTMGMPAYADTLFQHMVEFDSIRGPDSTGVMGISKDGKIDVLKGNADGYVFTRTKNWQRFARHIYHTYAAVFGHNRKATVGAVTSENAHPFQEAHITLMHNGTIRNKSELDKEVEVDSHAIAKLLAQKEAVNALGLINGAYALIWHDASTNMVHLARNSERPLAILEYDDVFVICSEPGLPYWLQGRDGRTTKRAEAVPTDQIVTFDMSKLGQSPILTPYNDWGKMATERWNAGKAERERKEAEEAKARAAKPAVVPSWPTSRAASTPSESVIYKAGKPVEFKVTSYEENDGVMLLGNVISDGKELDDVFVRVSLYKGEKVADYLTDGAVFTGMIYGVNTVRGAVVLYLSPNIVEVKSAITLGQTKITVNQELLDVLAQGCNKCGKPLSIPEIPQSIVQRKVDRWRVVCPACIADSKAAADTNAKERKLAAN